MIDIILCEVFVYVRSGRGRGGGGSMRQIGTAVGILIEMPKVKWRDGVRVG